MTKFHLSLVDMVFLTGRQSTNSFTLSLCESADSIGNVFHLKLNLKMVLGVHGNEHFLT
jgi:hypothetical protein